ncbi:hypothetical protein GOBAR_AA12887 [Gossypium barbadense]|uniref:Reverse transcriptase domain-containing protein n=1 Tax=Gossypium barbadense TaxID=3634 RepID=A0A2P5XWL8_GOSBA|nr:hypothetical protein GOBAR_AA12887 [Gossypium barbadense]
MNGNDFRRVQNKCRLQNGLTVNSEGRSGGLALMWKEGTKVSIQSFSKHHIDSIVNLENNKNMRVTGFYGHANPSFRNSSWDILRRVGDLKEGGRRGVRAQMNEFKAVMDDLALVDIKPDSGWFTWVNNRSGGGLVKERIDRFLSSVSLVENFPFIATKMVRQSQSDHDAILLDLWGRRPKDHPNDPRLSFKFDVCWAGDREAKKIIGSAWNRDDIDYGEKIERVRSELGYWQRKKYGKMKSEIRSLEGNSVKILKESRKRLDFLYAREESYWAQRSQSKWLREGDRNTRYFHLKATGRLKKNFIEKLKDMDDNWKNFIEKLKDMDDNWMTSSKEISQVAKNYFLGLFRSNGQRVGLQEVGYIQECVTRETNEWLTRDYTEHEVLQAIKQMNPNKAPGIDGLSGNFFKQHWEIVGRDTINFYLDVLNGNKNVSNLNETVIILIPKIRDPSRAHRNVANDSRTRFSISGKDLLGWLMHCYGLELGLPILPYMLGTPYTSQVGDPSVPWSCQGLAYIRSCP